MMFHIKNPRISQAPCLTKGDGSYLEGPARVEVDQDENQLSF